MGQYDGEQVELANGLAPRGCSLEQAKRAFAILAGAAASVAARLADEQRLGRDLMADDRRDWGGICSLLVEAADSVTPSEALRRERPHSLLKIVLEANARRAE